jgi:5-(carboxyamino)imidazole ribonucleotide synthase
VVRPADVAQGWASLNTDHAIAESFVPFDMEISVIVARGKDGAMQAFPPVHNTHKNGILDETRVPAAISPTIEQRVLTIAHTLAEKLDIVGLLAVEVFIVGNHVLMNEMAPRPHNSGHWSMDFCATSQFEQFVRALVSLPLGATTITAPCLMKNLIGADVSNLSRYANQPHTYIHLYGKKEIKAGRKMGHVNQISVVRGQ